MPTLASTLAREEPPVMKLGALRFLSFGTGLGADRSHGRALAAIVMLSLIVRLASALFQGDAIAILPGIHDQVSYDALARRVVDGYGFSFSINWWPATRAGEPTSHWSYFYTVYLALVYALVGPHPLAARMIQATVAGVLHPWLTWRLGVRLFGSRAGVIASLMAAIYGYFVYYAGALMTETFYVLAVLWVLDLASRIEMQETVRTRAMWIYLGLALGTSVLLRQVFLLFVPVLFLWILGLPSRAGAGSMRTKAKLIGILMATAIVAGLILPWTLRNYMAFQRFVLLNSNAGYAFFWANHPIHGSRFVPILPEAGPSYGDLIPPSLLNLDEARLDQALLTQGLRQVVDDPVRYLLLSVTRAVEFFKFWPSSASSISSNLARGLSSGLLLPLALVGLGVSLRRSRVNRQLKLGAVDGGTHVSSAGRNLMYLFISVYSLIHMLSWTLIRYRLPVDAVLVLFASAGVLWLWRRVTGEPAHAVDGCNLLR